MPKLPRDIKGEKLLKVLYRLGFLEVGRKGSHIRLKHKDGRWTQVAIHSKPIPQGTLKAVLRQAKISIEELKKIFNYCLFLLFFFSPVTNNSLSLPILLFRMESIYCRT